MQNEYLPFMKRGAVHIGEKSEPRCSCVCQVVQFCDLPSSCRWKASVNTIFVSTTDAQGPPVSGVPLSQLWDAPLDVQASPTGVRIWAFQRLLGLPTRYTHVLMVETVTTVLPQNLLAVLRNFSGPKQGTFLGVPLKTASGPGGTVFASGVSLAQSPDPHTLLSIQQCTCTACPSWVRLYPLSNASIR